MTCHHALSGTMILSCCLLLRCLYGAACTCSRLAARRSLSGSPLLLRLRGSKVCCAYQMKVQCFCWLFDRSVEFLRTQTQPLTHISHLLSASSVCALLWLPAGALSARHDASLQDADAPVILDIVV